MRISKRQHIRKKKILELINDTQIDQCTGQWVLTDEEQHEAGLLLSGGEDK